MGTASPGLERDRKEEQEMKTGKTHAILKRAKRSRSCPQLWHDESDELAHTCLYGEPYLLGIGQTSKLQNCSEIEQIQHLMLYFKSYIVSLW